MDADLVCSFAVEVSVAVDLLYRQRFAEAARRNEFAKQQAGQVSEFGLSLSPARRESNLKLYIFRVPQDSILIVSTTSKIIVS